MCARAERKDKRHEEPGCHHHRPVLGRSLRRAGGRAAGGHGVLPEIHRRQPDEHGRGNRPAGAEIRPHHPRRRRTHGPLHPRGTGARGRGCAGREDRPRAADGAGPAGHPRRQAVSADLLPRELRRHGAVRGRHRRGLHRQRAGGGGDGDPPEPPADRGRGAEGTDPCAAARLPDGPRHRLPPEPLGPRGPWRRRKPVH